MKLFSLVYIFNFRCYNNIFYSIGYISAVMVLNKSLYFVRNLFMISYWFVKLIRVINANVVILHSNVKRRLLYYSMRRWIDFYHSSPQSPKIEQNIRNKLNIAMFKCPVHLRTAFKSKLSGINSKRNLTRKADNERFSEVSYTFTLNLQRIF